MKPKFFSFLLLALFSLSAFAKKPMDGTEPQTAVRFAESFSAMIVDNELTVVLTEGTSNEITIAGDAGVIDAKVSDGCLYLSAKIGRSTAGTKVYVPSNALAKIYLNGNATLNSASVLPNARLTILLAAEARIHVKSTGRIDINTVDEIQFVKAR